MSCKQNTLNNCCQVFKQREIILKLLRKHCINSKLVNIIDIQYEGYFKILINNFDLIKLKLIIQNIIKFILKKFAINQ